MLALENERQKKLLCQVHGWMKNYLNHYLDGMDWFQANAKFGLDHAIYVSPTYTYDPKDLAAWRVRKTSRPKGNRVSSRKSCREIAWLTLASITLGWCIRGCAGSAEC